MTSPQPSTTRRLWPSLHLESAEPLASPSATAGSSSNSLGRGGALDHVQGIETGKCVVVLTSSEATASVCCASIGASGKLACFKPVSECITVSHVGNREEDRAAFVPGIYLIASGNAGRVIRQPVGEIELMSTHRDAILACEETNPTSWPALVNTWRHAGDSRAAAKRVDVTRRAREIQTPGKRPVAMSTELDFASPSVAFEGELDAMLGMYEDLFRQADDSSGQADILPLRLELDLGGFLYAQFERSTALEDASIQMNHEVHMNRTWSEDAVLAASSRITDIEVGVGLAPVSWEHGQTVWESIESAVNLTRNSPTIAAFARLDGEVTHHEDELSQMFEATSKMRKKVDSDISFVTQRVEDVAAQVFSPAFDANALLVSVQALESRVVVLEDQRNIDRAEIERLQSGLETGDIAFEIDHQHTLRSVKDVHAYLEKKGAGAIDFGGFCDVYTLLVRLQLKIDGAISIGDFLKKKKDARGVGMSDDETLVHYSFSNDAPPIFGGAKTHKSDIAKLQTYNAWRNKASQSGMYFEINSHLSSATREVRTIIAQSYSKFSELNSLACTINATAQSFISTLITWIDQTNDLLVDGGNDQADVWNLMAKVIRALFEEGLGPARTTPLGTTFDTTTERSAVMLWGVIRTHVATERMLGKDFRDHHIVTGNYAKWLVNHSGKKDAAALKKQVDKLGGSLDSLRETSATKKALVAVEKTAEAAKKTADKALNKSA